MFTCVCPFQCISIYIITCIHASKLCVWAREAYAWPSAPVVIPSELSHRAPVLLHYIPLILKLHMKPDNSLWFTCQRDQLWAHVVGKSWSHWNHLLNLQANGAGEVAILHQIPWACWERLKSCHTHESESGDLYLGAQVKAVYQSIYRFYTPSYPKVVFPAARSHCSL